MKKYYLLIIILIILGISYQPQKVYQGKDGFKLTKQIDNQKDFLTAVEIKILEDMIDLGGDVYIEFPDIYPSLAYSIASDAEERLIIVQMLKANGFEVTDWGRGNYPPRGARIISITVSNGKCECVVNKMYYLSIEEGAYRLAERIRCKRIKN